MEYRRLELNIESAKGLKNVNLFSEMNPYAEVFLSGDQYLNQEAETHVDRDGRTDPTWNSSMKFTVNETLARLNQLILEIKVRTTRNIHSDRDVGEVQVPVKQLLEEAGDGRLQSANYTLRKSAKPAGTLKLSYKFLFEEEGPQQTIRPPPPTGVFSAMEYRRFELNIESAKGLKNVNLFSKMNPYAEVFLSGDQYLNQKAETHVDGDGRTDPTWNSSMKFTVNETLARLNQLTLEIKVRTTRNIHSDRDVGEVQVPVKQLLEEAGDGRLQSVNYTLRKSAKPVGTLKLSYKFLFEEEGPQPTIRPPPPTGVNEAPVAGSGPGQYASPSPPPYAPPRQQWLGTAQTVAAIGNMVSNMVSDGLNLAAEL